MTLFSLITMIICSFTVVIISLFIFKGGAEDKKYYMTAEKCNNKDCGWCIDKNQCSYKREDLE